MSESVSVNHFVDVLALADLPENGQRVVSHGYRRILLCREGEQLFALEDLCPHAYQSLAGGEVRDGKIRCPRHGACFNLSNGLPVNTVSKQPVKVFAVRVRQGRIEVDLG